MGSGWTLLLLPLDLIPDFIPVAASSDDLGGDTALLRIDRSAPHPDIRQGQGAMPWMLVPSFPVMARWS